MEALNFNISFHTNYHILEIGINKIKLLLIESNELKNVFDWVSSKQQIYM